MSRMQDMKSEAKTANGGNRSHRLVPSSTDGSRVKTRGRIPSSTPDSTLRGRFPTPSFLLIRTRRATGAASGRRRTTHEGPHLRPAPATVAHRNAHDGGHNDADAHHASPGTYGYHPDPDPALAATRKYTSRAPPPGTPPLLTRAPSPFSCLPAHDERETHVEESAPGNECVRSHSCSRWAWRQG
ncbi:hypothetical protein B0H14DRAFT_3869773 [Mycena olivaceomarginata]|nr:hypothetical protein B0H14DRAFT_3869773 [Mycena olivaceomarginata]